MAGVVPEDETLAATRRAARKHWTLHHDGARGSLRQLRSSLAENGCDKSQLVLARQILESADASVDSNENYVQAVYWLVRSSNQGNLEATQLLTECAESGRGINDQNFIDVRSCLAMTCEEKRCRRAARLLFGCLSQGQEFITTEQIRSCLPQQSPPARSISQHEYGEASRGEVDPSDHQHSEDAGEIESSDEVVFSHDRGRRGFLSAYRRVSGVKLSEDSMLSVASHLSHGSLPAVSGSFNQEEDLSSMPILEKLIFHPIRSIFSSFRHLVVMFGQHRENFLSSYLPISLIKTALVVLVIPFVNLEFFLSLLPMLLMYFSLFVMFSSSMQIVRLQNDLVEFRIWSRALRLMDEGLDSESAEARFYRNNVYPYARVFFSLLVVVVMSQYVSDSLLLSSEITAFSTMMAVVTFISLREYRNVISCISLALHVALAVLHLVPSWRPSILTSVPIAAGVFLDVSLPSLLHVTNLLCYIRMTMQRRWRGFLQILVPHLIIIAWLQVSVLFCDGASSGGIARAFGLFFSTLLALPIFGSFLLVLPVLTVASQLYGSAILIQSAIIVALTLMSFLISRLRQRRSIIRDFLSSYQMLSVCVGLVSLLVSAYFAYIAVVGRDHLAELSWNQFYSVCHGYSLRGITTAQAQHGCHDLEGANVRWDGVVADVRIISRDNLIGKLLSWLPASVFNIAACFYGRQPGECNTDLVSSDDLQRCILARDTLGGRCSLASWNRYQFEIIVHMPTGILNTSPSVKLAADSRFHAFGLNLARGDRISFSGVLSSEVGTHQPLVILSSIRCISCATTVSSVSQSSRHDILNEICNIVGVTLNFLCSPLLRYEQSSAEGVCTQGDCEFTQER